MSGRRWDVAKAGRERSVILNRRPAAHDVGSGRSHSLHSLHWLHSLQATFGCTPPIVQPCNETGWPGHGAGGKQSPTLSSAEVTPCERESLNRSPPYS